MCGYADAAAWLISIVAAPYAVSEYNEDHTADGSRWNNAERGFRVWCWAQILTRAPSNVE